MDHGQLRMVADKFPWVFSEELRNACGTEAKVCRRQRTITPFRWGLALTAACASQRVATLADFHRSFHALFDTTMTSKAFSHQGAKPHVATCVGTMASRLLGAMTLQVLGCPKGRAFAAFRHVLLQDGSAFALHDALRAVFPGRVTAVKPAAVARHTTRDWLWDAPMGVVWTPATASAQTFVPAPPSLRDSVL